MPVLIPVVAAGAAFFGSTAVVGAAVTAGMVAAGSIAATVIGAVTGAVIGAAVSAVGALVTDGDIGESALWGAVGGAVAGGFAGASSVGSGTTATPATGGIDAITPGTGGSTGINGGAAASEGMSMGEGLLYSSLAESGGQALTGYAQGEAQAQLANENSEEAAQIRQEEFDQQMAMIAENHKNNMEQLSAQGATSLALADKNNAAAMDQLNTSIQADKDAAQAVIDDREQEQSEYSDSVIGLNSNVFDRPTFSFDPEMDTKAEYDSGFDEAVAAKENSSTSTSTELTPAEKLALEQAQTA